MWWMMMGVSSAVRPLPCVLLPCGGPQASGRIIVRHARGALWDLTIIVWYSGAVSVSRVERAVAETGSS